MPQFSADLLGCMNVGYIMWIRGLVPALFLAERTRKRGPQLKGKGHAQALPDPRIGYTASPCCRSTPARHDWLCGCLLKSFTLALNG